MENKRKIAFVMPSLLPMPPVRGGAVEALVEHIVQQNEVRQELDITIYCRVDPKAQALYGEYKYTHFIGIPVYPKQDQWIHYVRRGMRKLFHITITEEIAYLNRVLREMKNKQYDAVIVENQPAFVKKLHRLHCGPIYLHMHNEITSLSERSKAELKTMCKHMIAVSNFIAAFLRRETGAGEDQVVTLPNSIDVPRFDCIPFAGRRKALRSKLGIAQDEIVFLYAGRIQPVKGAKECAQAFAALPKNTMHLLFVGSQWYGSNVEDDYSREIKEILKPVMDRVHFTGFVPYPQMPEWYAMADIAILPALWEEPAGLTVLEAQASSLPVISTLSGGIPENVSPQGSVLLERDEFLVEHITQAMQELASDKERRKTMGEYGVAFAQHLDTHNYYQNFIRIF